MSRARLVVHAHFYQPSRTDPFSGLVPADPSAAPAHDWTARVSADCYRPNAEAGNLGHISWNLGPTLADWMRDGDPIAYRGFAAGDQGVNGMAQAFHHAILPLASAADRETEIVWGLRDFELRFGRRSVGMWLPETAVDLATLRRWPTTTSGTPSWRRGRWSDGTGRPRRAARIAWSWAMDGASWSPSTTQACRPPSPSNPARQVTRIASCVNGSRPEPQSRWPATNRRSS